MLRSNIEQVKHYIATYCEETGLKWCAKELSDFDEAIARIDGMRPEQDEAKVKKLEEMYLLLNHEYQTLITKWVDKDQLALIMGHVMAAFTFIFHLSVSFDKSGYEQGLCGLASLLVCVAIYLGTRLQIYELWEAAGIVLLISFFSSWTPRNQVVRRVWPGLSTRATWQLKNLIYPLLVATLVVLWVLFNHSDMAIQEQDFVIEALIMVCLGIMWASQPAAARSTDVPNIVAIVLCMRLAYFNDTEQSQNKDIPKPLLEARGWFQQNLKHLMVVFVIALFSLEQRIAEEFRLDSFFRKQAHTLTAMHVAYQVVVTYNNLQLERDGPAQTAEAKAAEEKRETVASFLGFSIYIAAGACILLQILRSRCLRSRPLHAVSISCGLIFMKVCMLLGGKCGVMAYFCFLLMVYSFAMMVKQRVDS